MLEINNEVQFMEFKLTGDETIYRLPLMKCLTVEELKPIVAPDNNSQKAVKSEQLNFLFDIFERYNKGISKVLTFECAEALFDAWYNYDVETGE